MTTQIRSWLDNAILQSVAESYIDQINAKPGFTLDYILSQGVNHPDLNANGQGATRLTATQINWFADNYDIITHSPNDATGFSATLFKNKTTGEYTLSFRSTEYQLAGKGGDYERDGVNGTDGEISQKGFALAQLSSMEDFYAHLKNGEIKNPVTGQWVSDPAAHSFAGALAGGTSALNVTGYSLGAHLATAFTLMHGADVQQTYTYNAAGVGAVGLAIPTGQDITGLIDLYRNIMAWDGQGIPSWYLGVSLKSSAAELTALQQAALAEPNGLPAGTANVYLDAKHQATMAVLAHLMFPAGTGPDVVLDLSDGMGDLQIKDAADNWWASNGDGPLGKDPNEFSSSLYTVGAWGSEIKQFYGHGEFFDPQAVANSGCHAPASAIWIEDLPVSRAWGILEMLPGVGDTQLIRDLVGDFGETHSITPIIDSLTVLDLLQGLDGSTDNERFTQIMKAMSNRVDSLNSASLQNATAAALTAIVGFLTSPALAALGAFISADKLYDADAMENFVNALTRIFTGTQGTLTPKKMQDGSADPLGYADVAARNDLLMAIEAIRASTTYQQSAGLVQIQALASVGATDMVTRAKTDMGYRYALKELLPFAITGDDALYAQHNATGGLDYYDPAAGTGGLTDAYLNDRAAMLVWKIKFDYGKRDINDLLLGVGDKQYDDEWGSNIADKWEFIDRKTQIDGQPLKLKIDGQGAMAYRQIVFGSDQDESDITGGSRSDRLYGGGGADTLTGKAGNDYLEGGSGFDTYIINAGDGTDTLLDSDGSGIVRIAGIDAQGSATADLAPADWQHTAGSSTWNDRKNNIVYTQSVVSGETRLLIHKGDSNVLVKGWSDGELGIVLGAGAPPEVPATSTIITGDKKPLDTDTEESGIQEDYDALHNLLVENTVEARQDILYGSAGNDHIQGLTGIDYLAGKDGDDLLEGGTGNDALAGGAGADHLKGEEDNDILLGDMQLQVIPNSYDFTNPGSLIAEHIVTVDGGVAIHSYQLSIGSSETVGGNDVIEGGLGDDLVFAGGGDDYIDGGEDSDVAFGQAGKDILLGQAGNDALVGDGYGPDSPFDDDYIAGGDGNDTLWGVGGNDILEGGVGDDKLYGDGNGTADDGDDILIGGPGLDTLIGGGGNDILIGGEDADFMAGGEGNDIYLGVTGEDTIYDEEGDDTVILATANGLGEGGLNATVETGSNGQPVRQLQVSLDTGETLRLDSPFWSNSITFQFANGGQLDLETLVGESLYVPLSLAQDDNGGNLFGSAVADLLVGGAGADRVSGHNGNDTLRGAGGGDTLNGGAGSDVLEGGLGSDTLYGGLDNDALKGDEDADTLHGGEGDDGLEGGDGDDILYGDEGNDTLDGGQGNNRLEGGAGDDVLRIGQGTAYGGVVNTLVGGEGNDRLIGLGWGSNDIASYEHDPGAVNVDLALGQATDGWGGRDTLLDMDGVVGSAFDDTLIGSAGDEALSGGAGDDVLDGAAGSDTLNGGQGQDSYVFKRGIGADTLVEAPGEQSLLLLEGLALEDLRGELQGNDLLLRSSKALDSVLIKDYALDPSGWQFKQAEDETSGSLAGVLADNEAALAALEVTERLKLGFQDAWYAQESGRLTQWGWEANEDGTFQSPLNFYVSYSETRFNGTIDLYDYAFVDSFGRLIHTMPNGLSIDTPMIRVIPQFDGKGYVSTGNSYSLTRFNRETHVSDEAQIESESGVQDLSGITGAWLLRVKWEIGILDFGQFRQAVYGWIETGPTSYMSGIVSYNVYDSTSVAMSGKGFAGESSNEAVSVIDAGNMAEDVFWGHSPQREFVLNLNRTETVYLSQDIVAGDGDNWILLKAGDTTNAGAGNDVIQDDNYYADQYLYRSFVSDHRGDVGYFADAGDGDDLVYGAYGDDVLIGGEGNDVLLGGAGSDTYLLTAVNSGHDLVYDSAVMRFSEGPHVDDRAEDMVLFGPGVSLTDLSFSFGVLTATDELFTTLDITWGEDNKARIVLDPGGFSPDELWFYEYGSREAFWKEWWGDTWLASGFGIEQIRFDDGTTFGINDLIELAGLPVAKGQFLVEADRQVAYVQALNTHVGVLASSSTHVLNIMRGSSGQYSTTSARDELHSGLGDNLLLVRNLNGTDIYLQPAGRVNISNVFIQNWSSNTRFNRSGDDLNVDQLVIGDVNIEESFNLFTIKDWFDFTEMPEVYLNGGYDLRALMQQAVGMLGGAFQNGQSVVLNDLDFDSAAVDWLENGFLPEFIMASGHNQLSGLRSLDDAFVLMPGMGHVSRELQNVPSSLVFDASVQASQVQYRKSGNDLVISLDSGDSFTLIDAYVGGVIDLLMVTPDQNFLAFDELLEFGITLTGTGAGDVLIAMDDYCWRLYGLGGKDVLEGNAGKDTLYGGAGADQLNGGVGPDQMAGGDGNDQYVVDDTDDIVTEIVDGGLDTVFSSVSYTLTPHTENLELTGMADLEGKGNGLDNLLIGNGGNNLLTGLAGNDTLDGGGGADSLKGGAGNDVYQVDDAGDIVIEIIDGGLDTVISSVSYTLTPHTENLELTGMADLEGTGNGLDNLLTGNGGSNLLVGLAGNDTLDGGAGADTLKGGAGNDTYLLGRGYGTDTVNDNDDSTGNTDFAQFLSDITSDQIWFRQAGNNLEASIIGTSDKLVIKNWYLGSQYHVEQFKTTDGNKTLLDSQVQNLVNAMAAFAPPAAGQTALPQNYQDALAGAIAANWQ